MKNIPHKKLAAFLVLIHCSVPTFAAEVKQTRDLIQPKAEPGDSYVALGTSIVIAGAALGTASLLFNNARDCDKSKDAKCESKKDRRGRTGLILGAITIASGLVIANIGGEQNENAETKRNLLGLSETSADLRVDVTPDREPSLSLAFRF